jgi:hypothetical protein
MHNWFCAEHRHDIGSFAHLETKLRSPAEYRLVYDFRAPNLANVGKAVLCALGGLVVTGPLVWAAGPALGGIIGGLSGLSGAAATKAGLALLGGGALAAGGLGIAGGLVILTGAGAALGGGLGAWVARAYLSDIEGFDIRPVRSGRYPAVITINGFLSKRTEAHEEWREMVDSKFPGQAWYHVDWESKRLADLGWTLGKAGTGEVVRRILTWAASQATKHAARLVFGVVTFLQVLALSKNPWHVAFVKSEKVGTILADILARCPRQRFILIGHSLGCRAIFSCLQQLATNAGAKGRIVAVHLLGGAVANGSKFWRNASGALSQGRKIHNYHSFQDGILKYLFPVGTKLTSKAVGRFPIRRVASVHNHDVSHLVSGHMQWKRMATKFVVGNRAGKRRRNTASSRADAGEG